MRTSGFLTYSNMWFRYQSDPKAPTQLCNHRRFRLQRSWSHPSRFHKSWERTSRWITWRWWEEICLCHPLFCQLREMVTVRRLTPSGGSHYVGALGNRPCTEHPIKAPFLTFDRIDLPWLRWWLHWRALIFGRIGYRAVFTHGNLHVFVMFKFDPGKYWKGIQVENNCLEWLGVCRLLQTSSTLYINLTIDQRLRVRVASQLTSYVIETDDSVSNKRTKFM